MKKVSGQEAFENFADAYGPNWHREGLYRVEWEPYCANWLARHPKEAEKERKKVEKMVKNQVAQFVKLAKAVKPKWKQTPKQTT